MANQYGDISPRTAAFAATKMLERALPMLCMAKFGQQQPIPKNKTSTVKFRRYNGFTPNTTALVEGATPSADNISATDVTVALQQFGRRTQITDVIRDMHEDAVLQEYAEIMGETAGQTAELVVFNALRGGVNPQYVNGVANRAAVNAAVNAASLDRVIRSLKRANAKPVTKMLAATDKVSTAPIRPSFIAFCHPDLQRDLEAIPGWKNPVEYGTYAPLGENELGSYKDIRFMASTLYSPFAAAGASGTGFLSNGIIPASAAAADVYPIIVVGADAYATVSLAGAEAVTPIVLNPTPSDSDPLGQRGHVGFKMYSAAVILNDAWQVRLEVACTV